jgi:hypothetical protein
MHRRLQTPQLATLLDEQSGTIGRRQLLDAGWTSSAIAHQVRSGRWQVVHPGVYVTFTGTPSFLSLVWASLLMAGPGAVASHRTAARLQGLVDDDPDVLDVTIPHDVHRLRRSGVRTHRTRHPERVRRPVASVPQTRLEVTVLDLVSECRRAEDVVGWLTRACQRRLTTPSRILDATTLRSRQRWRGLVAEVLADVADGVASPLELFYRKLERRHGLPRGEANALTTVRGTNRYTDVLYRRFRLRVELESLAWHPEDGRWRDARRDNEAAVVGDAVLRYDWRAVVGRPGETAAEVATVLRARGWPSHPTPCSATCALRIAA